MRRSRLLLAVVAVVPIVAVAACGDVASRLDVTAPEARIPDALAQLTLVEDHPQISPALFPHRLHVDAERMERDVACVECHHELADEPQAVPRRCTECHVYAFLLPEVDEREPHDHAQPPDL